VGNYYVTQVVLEFAWLYRDLFERFGKAAIDQSRYFQFELDEEDMDALDALNGTAETTR
jgi:hypothetical protein